MRSVTLRGESFEKKLTIEDMRILALSRGGKCLSINYINSKTPLTWECSEGHRWLGVPAKVKYGSWCKICSGNVKKSIEQMHELAVEYGGQCLSSEYAANNAPLQWACNKGHNFKLQVPVQETTLEIHYNYIFIRRGLGIYFNI